MSVGQDSKKYVQFYKENISNSTQTICSIHLPKLTVKLYSFKKLIQKYVNKLKIIATKIYYSRPSLNQSKWDWVSWFSKIPVKA